MTSKTFIVVFVVALLTGCATAPVDPNRPVIARCDQSANCFYERQIRSFQVLDNRTIVVLVGRDECPFKLELDGFFCDVTMASFLAFNDRDGRICTWDRAIVAAGPFPREDELCRVVEVTPMTDDELLEAYAIEGRVQPLPAKGSGEIEVVEESAPEASEPAEPKPADDTAATTPLRPAVPSASSRAELATP